MPLEFNASKKFWGLKNTHDFLFLMSKVTMKEIYQVPPSLTHSSPQKNIRSKKKRKTERKTLHSWVLHDENGNTCSVPNERPRDSLTDHRLAWEVDIIVTLWLNAWWVGLEHGQRVVRSAGYARWVLVMLLFTWWQGIWLTSRKAQINMSFLYTRVSLTTHDWYLFTDV